MRKIILTLLGGLCLFLSANAQNRTITGKVTAENGTPVSSASVTVSGTTNGTTTNSNGEFSLSIPQGAKSLSVSSVDMTPQTISIGSRSNYAITMIASNSTTLGEVVVLGYGSAKKKENVVGSITKVGGEVVENRPAANLLDALQGRVAGLQIYSSTGEPSSTPSTRIRGVGSIGASNTPLYVLDGVQVGAGSIVSLNPNDIESVTVLKDPSTTAIYGSRAANGVILYTTKKGRSSKPTFTVEAQFSNSSLTNNAEKSLGQFMNTKQLTDFWVATGYRTQAQVDALLKQYPFDTKWYKTYYKENVPASQFNASLSGGGGKTTYFVSGSHFKQEGLGYRSNFDRTTFRSNIASTVTNWLKFGFNLAGGVDNRQTNPYGTNNTNRGLALLAAPFYSPVDTNGVEYPNLIPGWGRYNPKYLAEKVRGDNRNLQFNPTGFVEISPIKGLIFRSQAGMDYYDYTSKAVQLPSYLGSLNNGNITETSDKGMSATITNTAEYSFKIRERNDITVLVGQEYVKNDNKTFSATGQGLTDDRLLLLSAAPLNRSVSGSRTESAYQSFFSRLDYGWNSKYFVSATGRQDQSSRFGIDNRTANFWSLGLTWKAKKESFLSSVNWLTDLSVRASTGTSGNSSIGDYDNLATTTTGAFNNSTAFVIGAAGNPLLGWEKQKQTNIGIDLVLFKRAYITLDVYQKDTEDQLFDVPFPYTSGFSTIKDNAGSIRNTGIDVDFSFDIVKTRKTNISVYTNFNYNKNKVTELFQGRNYFVVPNTGVSYIVGQPISYLYPVWSGVNPQNGLPEWYLPNADPEKFVDLQKDPSKVTSVFNSAALQQNTGINRYAPFTGGFGLNADYSGFYLTSHFSFAQGKYLINNDRYFYENPNQFAGFNQIPTILDYWKAPGDITTFPKYGEQFTQFDSRLIENASFIRLKAITIGYDFPKAMLAKSKIVKGVNFSVTGRNLWTLTKYRGQDPEVDSNLTLGANPNTRQMAVNLRLDF
ncbi:MAG: SusC/RagA family TonB-linked outer membrane protein [Pedobacter sp.]|nr:MAG: SusC/RagA family TonB-linked outer membrane protein [Pedobacter sp.]